MADRNAGYGQGTANARSVRPLDRRRQLVIAAMGIIAESGVDGLRTREVAARAGITHPSLHHHFPAKADLLRAVLEHVLGEQLVRPLVHRNAHLPAGQRLLYLLTELGRQESRVPRQVQVLRELHHYADRDPGIRNLIEPWIRNWRGFLVGLVTKGQRDGDLGTGLNPEAIASLVMLVILGSRLGGSLAPALDQSVIEQLGRLLCPPGPTAAGAACD